MIAYFNETRGDCLARILDSHKDIILQKVAVKPHAFRLVDIRRTDTDT
jgi:hypothetical protein